MNLTDEQKAGLAELIESGAVAQAVGVVHLRQALANKQLSGQEVADVKRQIARALELQSLAAEIGEMLTATAPTREDARAAL